MGYFRFILALAVSANHLWMIGGIGRYAVFSFYILSGFLMTTIIKNRYGTNISGLKKYAANRLLRIYPVYLMALLISLSIILILGSTEITMVDKNLSIPNGPLNWFMNVTLIGLDFNVLERTIPPSWTLFVEIFYYAMIPIAVRAGGKFVITWVVASLFYHLYLIIIPHGGMYGWNSRYGTVMAGSLGFSIGCFLQYYSMEWMNKRLVFISSMLVIFACYGITSYWFYIGPSKWQLDIMSTAFFYSNIFASAILIINLFEIKQSKISNLFGDFSYSFYLMHLPIGYLIFKTTSLEPRKLPIFAVSVIITLSCCFAIRFADKKINNIREKIKSGL